MPPALRGHASCTGTSLNDLHAAAKQNLILGRHEGNQDLVRIVPGGLDRMGQLKLILVARKDMGAVRSPGDVLPRVTWPTRRAGIVLDSSETVAYPRLAPCANKRRQ